MNIVPISMILIVFGSQAAVRPELRTASVKAAIDKGLRRIEHGAASYTTHRHCFSCHHQALPVWCMTSARLRGFAVEPAKIHQQIEFTLNTFADKKEQIAKGQGVPGGNTMTVYALMTLKAAGHPADETTDALIRYLLVRQRADGSWPALAQRPPTEGSTFTNNALALRSLHTYGLGEGTHGKPEVRVRVEKAVSRAIDWLKQNKPVTTEDRVSHLRGLVWAGADSKQIGTARELLVKCQHDDGSWSQQATLPGDAYATGTVMIGLRLSGMLPSDPIYQRGIAYLLRTQAADGAWLVTTRSHPVQTFFDNGDPGGKSQFISFAATNWAVLALLESFPIQLPTLL
jgi:squalene cyclase